MLKYIFPLFVSLLSLSPQVQAVKNLDMNQRILTAQKIVQATYLNGADTKPLDLLLAADVTITYQVAGQKHTRTKADFLETVQKIHTDNVRDVKFTNISCKAIGSDQVLVRQTSVHTRKGTGLNESGPGTYLVDDKATYTFVENDGVLKASKMDHAYTKTKID